MKLIVPEEERAFSWPPFTTSIEEIPVVEKRDRSNKGSPIVLIRIPSYRYTISSGADARIEADFWPSIDSLSNTDCSENSMSPTSEKPLNDSSSISRCITLFFDSNISNSFLFDAVTSNESISITFSFNWTTVPFLKTMAFNVMFSCPI